MEAGPELKRLLPRTGLIVLTMNEDSDMAREAMRLWASGYLLKNAAASELVKAIREVLRGRTYVAARFAQRLQDEFVRNPRQAPKRELTSRQREVLQLLVEGRTMKEAADALRVTQRTVAFHKYQIMENYGGLRSSDQLGFDKVRHPRASHSTSMQRRAQKFIGLVENPEPSKLTVDAGRRLSILENSES